jgi:hypothetical protein
MIGYKVTIAGIEMILQEEALEYIQNRNWEYIQIETNEPTHTIEEFMLASLNELIKK